MSKTKEKSTFESYEAGKDDFLVIVKLKALGAPTIKLIEVVPRQYSVTVKDQVLRLWMESLRFVYEANSISVNNEPDRIRRLENQRRAISTLMVAEAYVEQLVDSEELSKKTFTQWRSKLIIVRKMIAGWIDSDRERSSVKGVYSKLQRRS